MVKPIQFGAGGERDVGYPATTARVYDSQDADELVFLDISASHEGRAFLLDTLRDVAQNCFVPLTAGGGVRTLSDIKELLSAGADKVSVNSYALENPEFIKEAAEMFGNQCIIVSIDVRKNAQGNYEVYTERGTRQTGRDAVEWAREVTRLGAGEILLTSIDKEGTMAGYDLPLVRAVASAVTIPVIANGGAGNRQHLADVLESTHTQAVAASSIFHFSDSNLSQVKSFLFNSGLPVRPI